LKDVIYIKENTILDGINNKLFFDKIAVDTIETRHLLIPWSGGAFAPLGPFLCPTTEEKKWPIAPKPGP
jgi:hypothetical protein